MAARFYKLPLNSGSLYIFVRYTNLTDKELDWYSLIKHIMYKVSACILFVPLTRFKRTTVLVSQSGLLGGFFVIFRK